MSNSGQQPSESGARWVLPEAAPVEDPSPHANLDVPVSGPSVPSWVPGSTPPGSTWSSARPHRESGVEPIPTLASFDHPLTLADILDGSFEIMKARPRSVFLLAAALLLPVAVVVVVIDPSLLGGDTLAALTDPDTYDEGASSSDSNFGVTVLSTLVSSLQVTLLAAPIAKMVDAWTKGRDMSARAACRQVGLGWLWLVVAFVSVHVLELVGAVLLVLPGIAAMALFSVTAPALAVERLGPFSAMRRSWSLVKPRFFSTLWVTLLSAVIAGTLSFLLALLPLAVVGVFGFGGEQYAAAFGTLASGLVAMPFTAGVAVMLYFDLRIRNEALDIELALTRHFEAEA